MENNILTAFLGFWEVLMILAIIVLIFGPVKIIKNFKSLKKGAEEFKKAVKDDKEDGDGCQMPETDAGCQMPERRNSKKQ